MRKKIEAEERSPLKGVDVNFKTGEVLVWREDLSLTTISTEGGTSPLGVLIGLLFEQQLAAAAKTRVGSVGLLTKREIEVLGLALSGVKTSPIAEQLTLSVKTVETHKAHINDKVGPELDELRGQISRGVILGVEGFNSITRQISLGSPRKFVDNEPAQLFPVESQVLRFAYDRQRMRSEHPAFRLDEVVRTVGRSGVYDTAQRLAGWDYLNRNLASPAKGRPIYYHITELGQRRAEQEIAKTLPVSAPPLVV